MHYHRYFVGVNHLAKKNTNVKIEIIHTPFSVFFTQSSVIPSALF